jgi:hypothetical protein
MRLTIEIEGITELRARLGATSERLDVELRGASLEAAAAGIEDARKDHSHGGSGRFAGTGFHREAGERLGRDRGGRFASTNSGSRYTDRTGHLSGIGDGGSDENSHADQTEDGEAEMIWPVDYASFVDEGTTRSRAYPFTPRAKEVAAKTLVRAAERAIKTATAAFKEAG